MRSARGAVSASLLWDACILGLAAVVAIALYRDRGDDDRLVLDRGDWSAVSRGELALGPLTAELHIVEFIDYQCPGCLVAEGVLSELAREHPGRLRRVIRHLPLTRVHPQADSAARVSYCAAEQGAFERMHDALFEERVLVSQSHWDSLFARATVVDTRRLKSCISSEAAARRVKDDVAIARRLGVSTTPTIIIDGEWLRGVDAPTLRQLVRKRLR